MQHRLWIVISTLIFLLGGCSGGGSVNSNPINAPVGLSVSPATVSLGIGETQIFTATVTGSTNTGVTWSVQEGTAGGVINANGQYTAPSTIGTYHIIATSQANATRTVSLPVTVHTLVSIAPATANLATGGVQIFTATVTGSTNTGVTWSVQEGPAGGVIDANGKYTAPGTVGTYHIVATSQADGTQVGTIVAVTIPVPKGSATGTIQ